MTHGEVVQKAYKKLRNMPYLAVVEEMPVGQNRVDVIGISGPTDIRIVECKANRRDFERDDKWENYLPYCTKMGFAYPAGLISPDELPREIGLLEIWEKPGGSHWVRGCRDRGPVDSTQYANVMRGLLGRFSGLQRRVQQAERQAERSAELKWKYREKYEELKELQQQGKQMPEGVGDDGS